MHEATRILPKTCLALSWDQALLSLSWVSRFQAGKANRNVSHLVKYLCTCIEPELSNVINVMIVSSLACVLTWLPWHQTDLKLNTRALAATYLAFPVLLLNQRISLYNTGILRMWTDSGKISLYSVHGVPLTKNRLRGSFCRPQLRVVSRLNQTLKFCLLQNRDQRTL